MQSTFVVIAWLLPTARPAQGNVDLPPSRSSRNSADFSQSVGNARQASKTKIHFDVDL